jgi:hypothetical protein
MSQGEKSRLFQALKAAGVDFTKHYREYKTEDLQRKYDELRNAGVIVDEHLEPPEHPLPPTITGEPKPDVPVAGEDVDPEAAAFFGVQVQPPVSERDPNTFAGEHMNSKDLEEPIRTDEQGRVWLQEEVLKPATPRPRGRRVLQYTNTGTETKTVKLEDGTIESFEVAGSGTRTAEVKITLPSYQVGIYRDPRFPFKVFTYNGNQGFDFFEVQEFYGGPELVPLVPATIKRKYVSNVLCYDIVSTVRTIEAEARQLALQGRIQL